MRIHYKSYQDTIDFLTKCAKENPSLVKIEYIGKTWEKRDIVLATLTLDVAFSHLKPALLYTGTIHAREWIGNELAISFIDYVIKNYRINPNIHKILSQSTIYIVPCLNPDGFEYSRNFFSFWRKNRRDNGKGVYGVDLNRNFSVGFKKGKKPASNVYSGPEAFSEPETRAIRDFVNTHSNITMSVDYHSQGNVFFPAHKFRHEKEIDTNDLNILCANMVYEIKKVTGREYGIHRGKPPAKLIEGSGREYYYSKGILPIVVEVGTRNIPDYKISLMESIHEQIPALLHASSEIVNYSSNAPKRVENFRFTSIEYRSVTLNWEYEDSDQIYFEIYRNTKDKLPCNQSTIIGITKAKEFVDLELASGRKYFYNIRAVDKINGFKSPFAPVICTVTKLDRTEFSKTIFPLPSDIGYVSELNKDKNKSHFGVNSLFVGVDSNKGISYGVIKFKLDSLPKDVIIKDVKLMIYPINRVGVKVEKYGEWSVSMVCNDSIKNIYDFDQIHNAKHIRTLGYTIKSQELTQGLWKHWAFNAYEKNSLERVIRENSEVILKIRGPRELPQGRDSQIMQFDIGYGKFGGGIHFRPYLLIKYSIKPQSVIMQPIEVKTIHKDKVENNILKSGYDINKNRVFGYIKFDPSTLPDAKTTTITSAYIQVTSKSVSRTKKQVMHNIEFVDLDGSSYEEITKRGSIDYIDYELSKSEFYDLEGNAYEDIVKNGKIDYIDYELPKSDLSKNKTNSFVFDSSNIIKLEQLHKNGKNIHFIVTANSEVSQKYSAIWKDPKLVINYITRREEPVGEISNLKSKVVKSKVKLTWSNPKDVDFVGSYVVRNRFHPPSSPFDGVKIYAGKDEYTYDFFGDKNIDKYYGIFTYDNVPNYSNGVSVEYKAKKRLK